MPKSLARNILRQRIYSHALDYFAGPLTPPTQGHEDLLNDILILLKFWQTMRSEKKYLVASEVEGSDGVSLGGGGAGYGSGAVNGSVINASVGFTAITGQTLNVRQTSDSISMQGSDVARSMSTGTGGWYNTIPHSTSTLSKRSVRSKRSPFNKDSYDKEYMKKRNLILELLAVEIEYLITWYNPNGSPDLIIPGEESVAEWRVRPVKFTVWRDYTRLAWIHSPTLAIYLPQRVRNDESITDEVSRLVCSDPDVVSHIPEGLKYLVTTKNLLHEVHELTYMLTWSKVGPVHALSFFSRQYPLHPLSAQYAIKTLNSYPADSVLPYIPQLVQALRHDTVGGDWRRIEGIVLIVCRNFSCRWATWRSLSNTSRRGRRLWRTS